MADRNLIKKLARVLIALAWADGKVSNDEINSLKDLLYRLPAAGLEHGIQLSGREWARLEMYMEEPVGSAERARLVAELQNAIRSRSDKRLVIDALRSIVEADGAVSAEEEATLVEIEEALADVQTGILGGLERLLGSSMQQRREAVAGAPNREAFFDDFLQNKVYYQLARHLRQDDLQLSLTDEEQRKLALAGGLMAKVAHADREVTDAEFETIATIIRRHWDLTAEEAAFVAEVALASVHVTYDTLRMMRELFARTSEAERRQILTTLFAVAAADGDIAHDEHEEIRMMAKGLKLTHRDFIDAKLAVLERDG
jgi:uncharacterized tellurite resistance protein B-like protein